MPQTTAACNLPSRKLFAPMFRARWQNMQAIITDSVYLDQIPPAYKTYYIAFIQQCLEWSRGFVPPLHQRDFFATGVGYSICELMTTLCMSGGYRIESANLDTKAFMEKWCEDDLNNIFSRMFFEANAGGNALLLLTPVDGELYPSVIPVNRCVFQIGRTGQVSQAMILNRFIAGDNAYYTKEYRYMRDGRAYWIVRLSESTQVTSPSWGQNWLRDVPKCIAEQWRYCYGEIKPSTLYEMPERMRGIGVYNVKNKAVAVAIADLPGYSDSTLHTSLDILYSIDFNYTQAQVDQYMGKSTCLVPKQFSGRAVKGRPGTLTDGLTFEEVINQVETLPLDDQFYKQIGDNTVDGKPIQPIFLQPDLRGEIRRFIRDSDMELLASKIGISAGTLSSHLAGGGTKTDDQVNAEATQDEKTVGNKRRLANRAINAMLSDVAFFYGFDDDISIQWGRSTSNSAQENDQLLREYQAGTLSLRTYLRKRWTDMTEEEIEKEAEKIEEQARANNAFDPFGGGEGFNEYNGQTAESASADAGRSAGADPEGGEG